MDARRNERSSFRHSSKNSGLKQSRTTQYHSPYVEEKFMAKKSMKVKAYRHGAKKPSTPDGKPVDALSELGEKQMYAIGEGLKGVHFRIALVSPKLRTAQSAALLLGGAEDVPDLNIKVCASLDFEGLMPSLATTNLIATMMALRESMSKATVGDLLAVYPEGYGYHVAWRMTVEQMLREIYHEHYELGHFEGDGDEILVISHTPVLELATGNASQAFLPEAAGIEFTYEVDEHEITLVSIEVVPPPTVG